VKSYIRHEMRAESARDARWEYRPTLQRESSVRSAAKISFLP